MIMLNLLALAIPAGSKTATAATTRTLDRMTRWARLRLRYLETLQALRRLDDRTLRDLDFARADLRDVAWRRAVEAATRA
jgi:hypothetical protein